jgi:peptidyl-prolyl cis-trans isomerase D
VPPKASVIDTLVKENKITRTNLGLLTKKEIIDPAVSEAAFSLPLNAYSGLIKGQFGAVVVRVTKIEPGETTSFDKAKADIKRDIAVQRARDKLFDMHDKIENERASGARLDEIAQKLKLEVTAAPAVDKLGVNEAGKPSGVEPAVLEDAFQAEQGTDNEPIQLPNHNWIWFEVDKITPERERPLSEVRKQVEEQWLENQQRIALSDKAHGILDDIRKGKTLDTVARDLQLPLKTAGPFTREGKVPDFSASTINTAFRIAVGAAETGLAGSNKDRVVFVVKNTETPGTPQIDDKLAKNITDGMRDDLLYQFIASVQQTQGMTVNNELAERLTSGTSR